MFAGAFLQWSKRLPEQLASPVLATLRQTLEALQSDTASVPVAREAVEQACDHLFAQVNSCH